MGHAGMAHALRGLCAPGLPGVSVPSVFILRGLCVYPPHALRVFRGGVLGYSWETASS